MVTEPDRITESNRAVTSVDDPLLLGWLVDSASGGVRLVNRDGLPVVPEKQPDGSFLVRLPDGSTEVPRPVTAEDPMQLDVDEDGRPVVVVDGAGRRISNDPA